MGNQMGDCLQMGCLPEYEADCIKSQRLGNLRSYVGLFVYNFLVTFFSSLIPVLLAQIINNNYNFIHSVIH